MTRSARWLRAAGAARVARAALLLVLPVAAPLAQDAPRVDRSAWMNPRLPRERRVRALLARMTLEEKFWQLYMAPGDPRADSTWRHGAFGVQLLAPREPASREVDAVRTANAVQHWFVERTRLGIPAILFEEGVHGLMQQRATVFPAAIALAASWDTSLMRAVASVTAEEARTRGIRLLLSPVVNLARDPRWGRVEETYGEDSWLSSSMGTVFSDALERRGVVATPKHFIANFGDGGRDSYPVVLDPATLEDLYFPPFRAAIERGGAQAIMASYNSVNGLPASASPQLLTRTLRHDWKFGGIVMSDQSGVGGANVLHHTAADYATATVQSMRAGLDVIFQGGAGDASLFWRAFKDGKVPRATIDTAVARVLRLKFALGLFEQPYADTLAGLAGDEHRAAAGGAVAMRAAEASAVLLRNEHGLLPLSPSRRRVALIGPAALPLGGYTVPQSYVVPLVAGWQEAAPPGEVVQRVPGPGISDAPWVPVPHAMLWHDGRDGRAEGVTAEYFDAPDFTRTPVRSRTDDAIDARWTFNRPVRGVGTDWYAIRWTGGITLPSGGRRLAVEGDDGYRLWVDDTLVVDADRKTSYGVRATPMLGAGAHRIRLEYRQTTGNGRIRLLMEAMAGASQDSLIADAVTQAKNSDVAVIVVGVDEGEFRDRSSLHLPGRQEELIARVAATGTPVVVVIAAGGAVIPTPWIDQVDAVVQVFYPGASGATALSRLLHGRTSPAGRLPYTVPRSEGQLPLVYDHLPTGRGDDYVDGTGQPFYPFGYGLTYTTFAYSALDISKTTASARDTVHVRFTITNTGTVKSDEVPQLYVRHVTASSAQPVIALRGFARVALAPGESTLVDLPLAVSDLAVRDVDGRRRVLPGDVVLFVGASSRDIRLRGTLGIK